MLDPTPFVGGFVLALLAGLAILAYTADEFFTRFIARPALPILFYGMAIMLGWIGGVFSTYYATDALYRPTEFYTASNASVFKILVYTLEFSAYMLFVTTLALYRVRRRGQVLSERVKERLQVLEDGARQQERRHL